MFDVWKNVLEELKNTVSGANFNTFLLKTSLLSTEDGDIKIGVPNSFMQVNVRKNFDKNIREALIHNNIEVKTTEYIIQDNTTKVKRPREVTLGDTVKSRGSVKPYLSNEIKKNDTGLVPEYTFDSFIVGTNNDLAASVAKDVVEHPGVKRNPFFVYGKSGVGKTHLVQAVGNELLKRNPNLKILYTPINKFYNDFIESIKYNKPELFTKYKNLDVLIVDDFQLIQGKEKSQEEFFNLFNDMYLDKRQVIVTSDRMPEEIKTVDPRLASRLTQSGSYDIQLPSYEDKCAILQAKADFAGVEIEQEAIEYIAENVKTNIRDLNSEYEKLMALAELRGVTPLQIINSGYSRPSISASKRTTTPKKIIDKTAKFYEMSTATMLSKSRVANIKNARQVAMYLLQNELGLSTTKTAMELGMKDHTTVMNGVKRINSEMKLNFKLREDINTLREKIYE
jgi:chromosomal replication initiator protein